LTINQCPVRDLTPLEGMPLTSLVLYGSTVSDLTSLQSLKELTSLNLVACGKVHDLTPLKDLPVTSLKLSGTGVTDLSPLQGMKLTSLDFYSCIKLRDLTPLHGMPLKSLTLHDTSVDDLTPLADMKLERIRFTPRNIKTGLDVLRGMKSLKHIGVGNSDTTQLWPAAQFWERYAQGEFRDKGK
jgi:hypothetical protein